MSRKIWMSKALFIALLATSGSAASLASNDTKSKYGIDVVPLSEDSSYFKHSAAPDYWALERFLIGQETNSDCSIAATTPFLNGIRALDGSGENAEPLDSAAILSKVNEPAWTDAVKEEGGGIGLSRYHKFLMQTLTAFSFTKATVEKHFVKSEYDYRQFKTDLVKNEETNKNFMIINFDQGFVMDADDSFGHFALIGAYDAGTDRVLILDPDRESYQPYWVPSHKLLSSMISRGYVFVNVNAY